MKLSAIKVNPNNPRFIKDFKYEKLKKSIEEFPKMMELRPIVIDDKNMILGGNMRFRALKDLGFKDIPDSYIKKASELTEEEKKRFIISDNSSFGEWDFDLLANEWDSQVLIDWGVDVPEVFGENEESEIDNNYSREIKAPVYEPKSEKPKVTDLYNEEKENQLRLEILNSNLPQLEKEFLIKAAQRHRVFDYGKIADYYSHSNKEVQDLIEKSALVIIDFNKAIENGYVKMTEEMQNLYSEEHGIE